MFQKYSNTVITFVASFVVFVATVGVGPYSWFFTYQPAPPKELK